MQQGHSTFSAPAYGPKGEGTHRHAPSIPSASHHSVLHPAPHKGGDKGDPAAHPAPAPALHHLPARASSSTLAVPLHPPAFG